MKDGQNSGVNPNSQEGQMMMMMKMMVHQARAADELFAKTGYEEEDVNDSIQKLDLQKDPEFMQMV